jgi:hypothetical protein
MEIKFIPVKEVKYEKCYILGILYPIDYQKKKRYGIPTDREKARFSRVYAVKSVDPFCLG